MNDSFISLFLKEIIMSVISIILAVVYFIGNDGAKAVVFLIVCVYSATQIADWIYEEIKNGKNDISNRTCDDSMDNVYLHDIQR